MYHVSRPHSSAHADWLLYCMRRRLWDKLSTHETWPWASLPAGVRYGYGRVSRSLSSAGGVPLRHFAGTDKRRLDGCCWGWCDSYEVERSKDLKKRLWHFRPSLLWYLEDREDPGEGMARSDVIYCVPCACTPMILHNASNCSVQVPTKE